MLASIFTSKSRAALLVLSILCVSVNSFVAHAATEDPQSSNSRTQTPEEEDFQGTPYTQYGEFNESEEEEEETRFLQRGRLFGLGVGMGSQFATGNRGAVYQGGFPHIDLRLHYWFDFHLAMDLQFSTSSQFYELSDGTTSTRTDVNMTRVGADFKYYFDVSNLPAPITFAGPYLLAGVGAYTQNKTNFSAGSTASSETAIGVTGGIGLEFPIKPRKIYLNIEGRTHFMNFSDTYSMDPNAISGLADLSGLFWTASASLMLTW